MRLSPYEVELVKRIRTAGPSEFAALAASHKNARKVIVKEFQARLRTYPTGYDVSAGISAGLPGLGKRR